MTQIRTKLLPSESLTLNSLSDVTISSPADNELLAYDSSSSEWINQTPAEAGLDAIYLKLSGGTMTGDLIVPNIIVPGYGKFGSNDVTEAFFSETKAGAHTDILNFKHSGAAVRWAFSIRSDDTDYWLYSYSAGDGYKNWLKFDYDADKIYLLGDTDFGAGDLTTTGDINLGDTLNFTGVLANGMAFPDAAFFRLGASGSYDPQILIFGKNHATVPGRAEFRFGDGDMIFSYSNGVDTVTEYFKLQDNGAIFLSNDARIDDTLKIMKGGGAGATAKVLFKVYGATGDNRYKGGIFYERTGNDGVGKFIWALDSALDSGSVVVADEKMSLTNTGDLTVGKVLFGDGGQGLYSQADTFLDLFADGAVRIGDSSAGAPTNYTNFAPDGEISLIGTARVKKSLWLPFEVLKAPGTKPATYIDHGIAGAWQFSDGTDDTVVFLAEVPPDMDRSIAPTLKIGWSTNTTATDETAVWQIEYLWISPGEDATGEVQETLTVNSNAIAQANGLIVAEITGIDAPDATDVCVHCRLKRLGADANDDLTDTAELHGVCLSYTSNSLGESLT